MEHGVMRGLFEGQRGHLSVIYVMFIEYDPHRNVRALKDYDIQNLTLYI